MRRFSWRGRFGVAVVLVAAGLILAGCGPDSDSPPASAQDEGVAIGSAGGTITIDDPASAIAGLSLVVPADAYPNGASFSITSQPFAGKFPAGSEALTPLITVKNGGAFADEVMTVTIPIQLPADHFAMGFFVAADGSFEPMGLAALSDTSITVATRHFSDFLIAAISETELLKKITTGFKPGLDDFHFANHGSVIERSGHCSGQCLAAAWYYCEKRRRGATPLRDHTDNNGQNPTKALWEDDSLAYQLCTAIHHAINWTTVTKAYKASDLSPEYTWKAFLYSMHVTKEPQVVGVYDTDKGGGHAILAYAAEPEKGLLYVADPNYPGQSNRVILYLNGAFVPYLSGDNIDDILAGNISTYEKILYFAKTSYMPWSKLGSLWAKYEDGSVGRGVFPEYQLMTIPSKTGDKPKELFTGMGMPETSMEVEVVEKYSDLDVKFCVRQGGAFGPWGSKHTVKLTPGKNRVGFFLAGSVANGKYKYMDFRWMDIHQVAEAVEEPEEPEEKPKPLTNNVITGVYYGQLKTNTRSSGAILWIVDAKNRFALRNPPEILYEKKGSFGDVVETGFRFRRGLGSPPIPPGQWRVCAGSSIGDYRAKSAVFTTGQASNVTVTVGIKPPE